MKKSIVLAWLGLAVSVAPAFGVGYIMLDNYDTYGPDITYWLPGWIAGPGLQPSGWGGPWTVGFYYAMGDVTKSVAQDPSGASDPVSLYPGFILGTGPGSTATVYYSAFDTPGEFLANSPCQIPGDPGDTITVIMVAYDLASYTDPQGPIPKDFPWGFAGRGSSAAFTMTLSDFNSAGSNLVGDFMPGFGVSQFVPEPGVPALGGLGASVLMLACRKMRS